MYTNIYSNFLILICVINFINGLQVYDTVNKTMRGSSGALRLRLNQQGLDMFKNIIITIMDAFATKIRLDDVQTNGVNLKNMKILEFHKPESSTINFAPTVNGVHVEFRKMFAHLQGFLEITQRHLTITSDIDTVLNGLTVILDLTASDNAGHLHLNVAQCQTTIDSTSTTLNNIKGVGKGAAKVVARKIDAQLPTSIAAQSCEGIKKLVTEDVNRELDNISGINLFGEEEFTNQQQSKKKSKNANDQSLQEKLAHEFDNVRKLRLNTILSDNPLIRTNFGELTCKGEYSWDNKGGTPYNQPRFDEITKTYDRMITLIITDYILNSLLYQANKHDLLHFQFGADDFKEQEVAELIQLLFDVILGAILPDFEEQYPNYITELETYQIRAPVILFEKNGNLSIETSSVVKLFARKNRTGSTQELIMEAQLNAIGNLKLNLAKQKIRGNVSSSYFNLQLISCRLKEFDQAKTNDLARVAKSLMVNFLQTLLDSGLKIPEFSSMRLMNTKSLISDRTWKLESDLKLEDKTILKQIEQGLKEKGKLRT